uniref:Uncharacterized protein n=1 Tax=Timema bartmani TaxID=61472 RepID=A0A7R9EZC4_9NEOP|nr:unnamed protein product [Timema bartmani]
MIWRWIIKMSRGFLVVVCTMCLLGTTLSKSRDKRYVLVYPDPGSKTQLILGFGIPISFDFYSLTLGTVIKIVGNLPTNASYITQPYVVSQKREIQTPSRWDIYSVVEQTIERFGFDGKGCLLRTICEAAKSPFNMKGLLLSDLLHIFLTPSVSDERWLHVVHGEYFSAESLGSRPETDCHVLYPECPASLLDAISTLFQSFNLLVLLFIANSFETSSDHEESLNLLTLDASTVTESRQRRYLVFPTSSSLIELGLSFSIPITIENESLTLASILWYLYYLPYNATQYTQPYLTYSKRDLHSPPTRWNMYSLVEHTIDRLGIDGRACLLRMICETSQDPVQKENGILGEMLHVFFTPSSTEEDSDRATDREYRAAEIQGYQPDTDCEIFYPECPHSLLDLVSEILIILFSISHLFVTSLAIISSSRNSKLINPNNFSTTESRQKRYLVFPTSSTIAELVLGFGIPINIDKESLSLGVVYYYVYSVPYNSTQYTQPYLTYAKRDIHNLPTRWNMYMLLEQSLGRPSSTDEDSDLATDREYRAAEIQGYQPDTDCEIFYPECPHSLLDLVSEFA